MIEQQLSPELGLRALGAAGTAVYVGTPTRAVYVNRAMVDLVGATCAEALRSEGLARCFAAD